jgi:YHS domain-containing protein
MNSILTLFALLLGATAPSSDGEPINKNCPVGKQAIDQETFVEYGGHTIGFCCGGCDTKFLAWDAVKKDAFVQASLAAQKQEPKGHDHAKVAKDVKPKPFAGDPYLLHACPVSGKKLGSMGAPIVLEVEGREVRLCCKGCIKKVKAEPAKYAKAVDDQIIAAQKPLYPSTVCIVSGESLLEDGKDVGTDTVVKNRLFRTCCKKCAAKVKADPAKYFAKLDKAVVKAQLAHYPLKTCIVREKSALGSMGEPVNLVVGMQMVRFCCDSCIPKFEKDPAKFLARLKPAKKVEAAHSHDADGHEHKPGE